MMAAMIAMTATWMITSMISLPVRGLLTLGGLPKSRRRVTYAWYRRAMGYHSARRRTAEERRLGPLEVACIVLVVAAIAALIAWIVATAGGGALMI